MATFIHPALFSPVTVTWVRDNTEWVIINNPACLLVCVSAFVLFSCHIYLTVFFSFRITRGANNAAYIVCFSLAGSISLHDIKNRFFFLSVVVLWKRRGWDTEELILPQDCLVVLWTVQLVVTRLPPLTASSPSDTDCTSGEDDSSVFLQLPFFLLL